MLKTILIPILLFLSICLSSSQTILTGKIIDKKDKAPIAFANISIELSPVGTASDESGNFMLIIEPGLYSKIIKVSCIGYHNRYLKVDSLISVNNRRTAFIDLQPATYMLAEVMIKEKPIDPETLLNQAIGSIPNNYAQTQFNMEFYSKLTTSDSIQNPYVIETILLTYRKGYMEGGALHVSKIIQKRESGINPITGSIDRKTIKYYFPYFPAFDISLIDQIGVGNKNFYSIFNPSIFKKMKFKNAGITYFDKDTVCVINYWLGADEKKRSKDGVNPNYDGTIYIAINNLAIIRHTLVLGKKKIDIVYRSYKQKYYPYVITSTFPHIEKNKTYWINHKVFFKKIITDNVQLIENKPENWHPEDIAYNPSYWDMYYPEKK
jgi:hypothetical protein